MSRPLSPFIQSIFTNAELLNSRTYNTLIGFEITFTTGVKLYLGTGTFAMTSISKDGVSVTLGEPIAFQGKIDNVPNIKFNHNQTSDIGEISAENLEYALTQLIPSDDRLFDNAKTKVYLGFPKPDGTFEGLIIFRGIVRNLAGDNQDASYSLLSDFSDKRSTIVEQITQKCVAELGDSWCGAQHIPTFATCSKVYSDEENGCAFWGQQHAFKGIPFFNPVGLLPSYNGGVGVIGVGGWDENGNPTSIYNGVQIVIP